MSSKQRDWTVLFADICRSREYYLTLGDEEGQRVIMNCLELLISIVLRHQGKLIKTIGDEVLCIFPSSDLAVEAAMDMNRSLAELPFEHDSICPPGIHSGMQTGPVVHHQNDIFGDTVNVAARLVTLAKRHQILTTKQTVSCLCSDHQSRIRHIDRVRFKGQIEESSIYNIAWEEDHDETLIQENTTESSTIIPRLKVVCRENSIVLDQSRPIIHMGRHASNDIQIQEGCVSRIHARIENRKGKYILVDQSTNGTFLVQKSECFHIHNAEINLETKGFLGLGRKVTRNETKTVVFETLHC